MRELITTLAVLLAACAGNDGTPPAPPSTVDPDAAIWPTVDTRVLADYATYGSHAVLLVGDSITARNPIQTLCGLPVINAGYSGGTWQSVADRPIWSQVKTKLIVVMLGTNNVIGHLALTQADVTAMLSQLQTWQLILETMPPEYDRPETQSSWTADNDLILAQPEQVIDSRTAMADPTFYIDGIHPNAAGYVVYNQLLEQGVCPWVNT